MDWQPIETAPKDGRKILLSFDGSVTVGYWDINEYNKKPKPFWNHSEHWRGVAWTRACQPKYWMQIKEPPDA